MGRFSFRFDWRGGVVSQSLSGDSESLDDDDDEEEDAEETTVVRRLYFRFLAAFLSFEEDFFLLIFGLERVSDSFLNPRPRCS